MSDFLADLSRLVVALLARPAVSHAIERLKREVRTSDEPFVWTSLDLEPLKDQLPSPIRSGWIFVLQQDRWSGAHLHPNSTQHMAVLEGHGRSRIGGELGELAAFDSTADERRRIFPYEKTNSQGEPPGNNFFSESSMLSLIDNQVPLL
jgi:hypothetical protein